MNRNYKNALKRLGDKALQKTRFKAKGMELYALASILYAIRHHINGGNRHDKSSKVFESSGYFWLCKASKRTAQWLFGRECPVSDRERYGAITTYTACGWNAFRPEPKRGHQSWIG